MAEGLGVGARFTLFSEIRILNCAIPCTVCSKRARILDYAGLCCENSEMLFEAVQVQDCKTLIILHKVWSSRLKPLWSTCQPLSRTPRWSTQNDCQPTCSGPSGVYHYQAPPSTSQGPSRRVNHESLTPIDKVSLMKLELFFLTECKLYCYQKKKNLI